MKDFAIVCLLAIGLGLVGCGGGEDASSGSNDPNTTNSNDTSNGTTSTSNGTANTSNGTTSTSNGTSTNPDLCGGVECPDGERCEEDVCIPDSPVFDGVGLSVGLDARACELILLDPQNAVQDVVFDESVDGRFLRRGERIAIAFHAVNDAALDAGSVSFQVVDGQANSLNPSMERCFGSDGLPLDNPELSLKR